ncbi:BTAD domain-containing putative transcriptional regulator [Dactylosporangium sp. CS-033363]|uniref:BTAD domain-containing putative transcriptional regulator n=1 Tax=Dactylosporangium sp. CS-033363 TaxID=3239935 RepID=UPI003D8D24EB
MLGTIEIIDPADAGGVRLTGEDLPRRARQVLGVLAARHDRVQSKDALADAVWGEELPGNHAAALEHYVSVLRRALQPGVPTSRSFIVTRAGGYVFATDRARLDLAELRAAARVAEAEPERMDVREEIVRLVRDLPFAEDEYADWAAPARAEVKAVLVGALLDLAERAVEGHPGRALRLGRQALELEAYAERGYRVMMRAAAGEGRKDEVVRWYERCVQALTDELGIVPGTATTALRDSLVATLEGGPPAFDRRRGDRRKADRESGTGRANLALVRDVAEGMATVTELPGAYGAAEAAANRAAANGTTAHGAAWNEGVANGAAARGTAGNGAAANGSTAHGAAWNDDAVEGAGALGIAGWEGSGASVEEGGAHRVGGIVGAVGNGGHSSAMVGGRRRAGEVVPGGFAASGGFVGRSAELEALAYGADVVHVAGPAGAGKSALLGRVRELFPGAVGLGRGPGPGGALRLGWLRTVLHQLGVGADGVLDAAMSERRHLRPAELDGIAGRLLGREQRALIAIDDAEHLDADSVAELRWLQERGVRVAVTYRYPSAIAERPLGALEAGLVLRLAPLTAEELPGELLDASGGIPALVTAARELQPELAREVAMHLARQRTRWMPPAAWEILRLTAALGSLRVEQVAAAGQLELDEVLSAVDQLVHAHLLVEGPGGHVRHRSGLVRGAVAAQVSAARGQHLRARLA